jgi:rhodanese-related sulfurtransferase
MFNFFNSSNQSISPKEVWENLKADKDSVLIDVREDYEFASGAVERALSYPLSSFNEATIKDLKKYKKIYVICASGGRSMRAVSELQAAGLDAENVSGGMMAWQMAGLPMNK